jgi:hypothetical protein
MFGRASVKYSDTLEPKSVLFLTFGAESAVESAIEVHIRIYHAANARIQTKCVKNSDKFV